MSSFFENTTGLKLGDSITSIIQFSITVMQSIKMVPSGIKIGKEQLNVLAYADDIVLTGKNKIEVRQLFVVSENKARKLELHINQGKTKYMIEEWKKR